MRRNLKRQLIEEVRLHPERDDVVQGRITLPTKDRGTTQKWVNLAMKDLKERLRFNLYAARNPEGGQAYMEVMLKNTRQHIPSLHNEANKRGIKKVPPMKPRQRRWLDGNGTRTHTH